MEKERVERIEREAKEKKERKKMLIKKRKDDLLRGNPFRFATHERATKRQPQSQQTLSSCATTSIY